MSNKTSNLVLKRLVMILALNSSFAFALDLSGVGSVGSQIENDAQAASDKMNEGIGAAIAQLEAERESKVQVTINVPYDLEAIPEGFASPNTPDKPFTGYKMECMLYTHLGDGEHQMLDSKSLEINDLQGTATFKWSNIPHQKLLKLSSYTCHIRFTGTGTSNLTPNTIGVIEALETINYRSSGSFE